MMFKLFLLYCIGYLLFTIVLWYINELRLGCRPFARGYTSTEWAERAGLDGILAKDIVEKVIAKWYKDKLIKPHQKDLNLVVWELNDKKLMTQFYDDIQKTYFSTNWD